MLLVSSVKFCCAVIAFDNVNGITYIVADVIFAAFDFRPFCVGIIM